MAEQLRQTARLAQGLLDGLQPPAVLPDSQGIIGLANPAWLERFGVGRLRDYTDVWTLYRVTVAAQVKGL